MNTKDFIERGQVTHKENYDFSKSNYVNPKTKIIIICPEHGEFSMLPYNFLKGQGCPVCRYIKSSSHLRNNIDDFVKKAQEVHGNKYDYSKVDYKNTKTKVCIICPEHGEFWQTPEKHINCRQGCPKCRGYYRTTDEFIELLEQRFKEELTFEKTEYKGSKIKVCVTCKKHGDFYITPHDLLSGQGCPKCGRERIGDAHSDTQETFMNKVKDKGLIDLYDFSEVVYEKSNKPIRLYCKERDKYGREHGYFYITPNGLLMGHRCPKCSNVHRRTKDELIYDFRRVHGDKYDYSKVVFKNMKTKVCIICPEHGEFWQTPCAHMQGQGCPQCKMSHLENKICRLLKDNNIIYEYESNINGILKRKTVDFYLPKINIAIECQGGQHFYGGFNRNDKEKANQIHYNVLRRDIQKKEVLDKNNIRVMYFTDITDLPTDIFTNTKYKGIYCENNFYIDKDIVIEEISKL